MSDAYHETRLSADQKRTTVWQALWRYYFSRHVKSGDTVLDLGSGYGDFINAVVARRRIAVDAWPGLADHVDPGVEPVIGSVTDLSAIADGTVDYAFASNLLEHLAKSDIAEMLGQLRQKLTPCGTLSLLQPNYRYASSEYFDDYTHITIFSHISLPDFLKSLGWEVLDVRPRFLPLTVKSRLPTLPFLIGLYLAAPIKPLGKQMLVVARPRRT